MSSSHQQVPSVSAESGRSCLQHLLPSPLISVVSPANGSGKTSLACALVAALPGSSAVKFTTVRMDGTRCPRSAGSCACHSLHGEFSILEAPEVILQPDTDTARLAAAGARRVLWCLAWPGTYEPLLRALAGRIEQGPVVTEGNSVLRHLPGARLVFVLRPDQPPHRYKRSTFELLERSELVVVNGPAEGPVSFPWQRHAPEAAARLQDEIGRRRTFRADLREPLPSDLLDALRKLALEPPAPVSGVPQHPPASPALLP